MFGSVRRRVSKATQPCLLGGPFLGVSIPVFCKQGCLEGPRSKAQAAGSASGAWDGRSRCSHQAGAGVPMFPAGGLGPMPAVFLT